LGGIGSGAKESIRWAAAPTSHLAAHSRSRLVPKKKTLFLADGLFFSLDRCLLMGDPLSHRLPINLRGLVYLRTIKFDNLFFPPLRKGGGGFEIYFLHNQKEFHDDRP
jgi:hypothetical protein